jgi:hypothetical protein
MTWDELVGGEQIAPAARMQQFERFGDLIPPSLIRLQIAPALIEDCRSL